ncbi:hypothetical protein Fleli_3836 [Bernardetia litoralis DSM 6794]|uniref:Lipoprotein n=1 Tax=Bernardetia litoralis (strain ATCC 23117 / DSM 6794 / NBRC 15988 / NCIMB 1366 / Fx l1 / Sio-4) TaxID=880071 RepID=I4AQA7_BERLS|nr:hypothetical protein [Bernardetia litoralis]AFM06142.1 hypothetical protein Fleli_3836 [Bernardetia litoralis DSM 6794]
MLKQFKTILAFAALLVFFTACGEHNQPAPNKGKNLDNTRIYGQSREAEPEQLPNQYDDPEGINEKSKAIYDKMYAPKEAGSTKPSYITSTSEVQTEEVKVEETVTEEMVVEETTTEETTTTQE